MMNVASQELQTLFSAGTLGGLSDGRLLERFAAHREGAAFEALLHRHGPMVWGVCRRVLQHHHDAEDAFQATFLVLARKGHSIAGRELVANWLYGVAWQTAMKARSTRARKRSRESQVPRMPEPMSVGEDQSDERLSQLDREICRLPDKYRIPVVLCELEGKTHREAAEQLGWPVGTVSGRLSRAKAILSRRLTHHGLTLSVASMAVLPAPDAASAGMPKLLVPSTVEAACRFATSHAMGTGAVSSKVASLTRKILRTMVLRKLKNISLVLMAMALAGAGAWQIRGGHDQALPEDNIQVTVQEVISDANTIVTRIDMDTLPGAWVEVVSDKAGEGGGGVLAPGQKLDGLSHTQLVIFADHVEWKPGSVNVLKFMMSLKGSGNTSFSNVGPMPVARRLAEAVTVDIKPGDYQYGVPAKLATFGDVTYRLVVKRPGERTSP